MASPLLIISLSIIIFSLIYKTILYPVFISPLSKVPNANPIASFSPLWILWKRYKKQENQAILAAHEEHGPLVRLGPYELSVNCVDEGLRTIYPGGFEKSTWYFDQFLCYGYVPAFNQNRPGLNKFSIPSLFTMTDSKPHSVRKRMISNVYSKSYLQSSPDMAKLSEEIIFNRLFPILESLATKGTPTNVLDLNFAAAMDFITAYLVGSSNATNFLEDENVRRKFLNWYQNRRPYSFWNSELPKIRWFLTKLGIEVVPQWVETKNQEIESFCLKMCNAAGAYLSSENPKQGCFTNPVVYERLAQSLPSPIAKEPTSMPQDLRAASEIEDHLAAGHETAGITLTYYVHELSQRPSLQNALRTELLSLSPPLKCSSITSSLPSPRSLDGLPLLHATLMETLRLHAPIPGPQPRMTPSIPTSLAKSPPLSAGITVSANAHCLHRNKDVFPHPNEWRPERWLTENKACKDEMMRWFWAFGSGGRMCIGSNFAMQGTSKFLDF